jgi:arylsulfatase A
MIFRQKYLLALLGALFLFGSSLFSDMRPNIILVMVDDFGHECVESYGGESYTTPQLNRMANEGVQFNHAHSQNICTPSRVQIMTGKYNVRNYTRFANLDHSEYTFGNAFQEAGYATCISGKWQLGGNAQTIKSLGFDEHCLWRINGANDERYVSPTLLTNGKSEAFPGLYGPRLQQEFVASFIQRNKSKTFFVYYPMTLPHYPFQPTPNSDDWDPERNPRFNETLYFNDMVSYLDKLVGELIDLLIKEGIDENTMLIFTSDNGTDHRIRSLHNGLSIPGAKGKMTEDATHVPFLVRWPAVVDKNSQINGLIDFSDIYATLIDVAGIDDASQPKNNERDGHSFLPLLTGEQQEIRDHSFCWYMERTDSSDIKSFIQNKDYKLHSDGRFIDKTVDRFEFYPLKDSELLEEQKELKAKFKNHMDYYLSLRPERIPYKNSQAIQLPGVLEFEAYDIGMRNVTYYDLSKGNSSSGFWRREDVDILSKRGRHFITNTEAGEWLEYTIQTKEAGEFSMTIKYSAISDGAIHFEIGGKPITPSILLPKTSSETMTSLSISQTLSLPKGKYILRLVIDNGNMNLDSLNVRQKS